MLSLARSCTEKVSLLGTRRLSAMARGASSSTKTTGDISAVFPSLKTGSIPSPLPSRFAKLKERLRGGYEDQIRDSWHRLLRVLHKEIEEVKAHGSAIVPELNFGDIHNVEKRTIFRDRLHKVGVAIIREVVPEQEALNWKELVRRYIQNNPFTKGIHDMSPYIHKSFV